MFAKMQYSEMLHKCIYILFVFIKQYFICYYYYYGYNPKYIYFHKSMMS